MDTDRQWNQAMAERLRLLRKRRGITQQQAGEATGLGRETISNYERGCRTPSPRTVAALAGLYETTADYVLGLSDTQYFAAPDGGQQVLEDDCDVQPVTGVTGWISVGAADTAIVQPCAALDDGELGLAEVNGSLEFVRCVTIGQDLAVMSATALHTTSRSRIRVIGRVRSVRFSGDRREQDACTDDVTGRQLSPDCRCAHDGNVRRRNE